jgi:hypothetical protein
MAVNTFLGITGVKSAEICYDGGMATKRKPPEQHKPNGRPSLYTPELAATICERIASGESLKGICREEGMPSHVAVLRWALTIPEFRNLYTQAREMQAEILADELLEIADDGRNDWMEKHDQNGQMIGWRENGEAMRRSQLRIETRKWVAAKLMPKRWGDKNTTELTGPGGAPLAAQVIDTRNLPPEAQAALYQALQLIKAQQEAEDISHTEEPDT